jgi:hypothetical protein
LIEGLIARRGTGGGRTAGATGSPGETVGAAPASAGDDTAPDDARQEPSPDPAYAGQP